VAYRRLSGWPEAIADEGVVTFFTLTRDDLGWLAGFTRDDNRLGVAVQLAGYGGGQGRTQRVKVP
jgi:hypothetical protein